MSETPSIDPRAVQNTLAEKIEAQEQLQSSEELERIRAEGSIAENVHQLRMFLTAETGEDGTVEDHTEVAAERAALQAAITETAAEHAEEGVSETLIMLWINGENVAQGIEGLQERGIRTYRDLLNDEEAIKTIQQIGVDLGLDLGEYGENEDGVDGNYGERTRAAWRQVQQALVDAGYNLGEFGENNDGVDGAVGEVTMNVLLQAARGVAPDAVVELAAAEAGGEVVTPAAAPTLDPAGAAAVTTAMRPEGREGAYTAEERARIGEVLAEDHAGIDYTDGVFTHKLGGEASTRSAHEIFGTDINDIEPAEARQRLAAFNTEQIEAFATANDVTFSPNGLGGEPAFERDERFVLLQEVLGADDPAAYLTEALAPAGAAEPAALSEEFLANLPEGVFYDEISAEFNFRNPLNRSEKVGISMDEIARSENPTQALDRWAQAQRYLFSHEALRFTDAGGERGIQLYELGLTYRDGAFHHPYSTHSPLNWETVQAAEDPQAIIDEFLNTGFERFASDIRSEMGDESFRYNPRTGAFWFSNAADGAGGSSESASLLFGRGLSTERLREITLTTLRNCRGDIRFDTRGHLEAQMGL